MNTRNADHCSLAGMHKHFRMIAISENLRGHGYPPPQDFHTRPPGIWKKLSKLYNLDALDNIVSRIDRDALEVL